MADAGNSDVVAGGGAGGDLGESSTRPRKDEGGFKYPGGVEIRRTSDPKVLSLSKIHGRSYPGRYAIDLWPCVKADSIVFGDFQFTPKADIEDLRRRRERAIREGRKADSLFAYPGGDRPARDVVSFSFDGPPRDDLVLGPAWSQEGPKSFRSSLWTATASGLMRPLVVVEIARLGRSNLIDTAKAALEASALSVARSVREDPTSFPTIDDQTAAAAARSVVKVDLADWQPDDETVTLYRQAGRYLRAKVAAVGLFDDSSGFEVVVLRCVGPWHRWIGQKDQ